MNKLISGGAIGADSVFAIHANIARHQIVHYSFKDHKIFCPGNIIVLDNARLNEANQYLNMCNKVLKRNIYKMGEFSRNLLRRSMIKVIDNDFDSLYAVGYLNEDQEVSGGTAWAVTIFDILNKGKIYFFNQNDNKWYYKNFNRFELVENVSILPGTTYLGIGTRKISDDGKKAISSLFKN